MTEKLTPEQDDDRLLIIHCGDKYDEFYVRAADLRITDDEGNSYTVQRVTDE